MSNLKYKLIFSLNLALLSHVVSVFPETSRAELQVVIRYWHSV